MMNRRKEPFRYSINPPAACLIQITAVNENAVYSKLAEAQLVDISKSGCRIRSTLNLYIDQNAIHAAVHVQFREEAHVFNGQIRWQQHAGNSAFHYGMQLELDDDQRERLNRELRTLAAEQRILAI